MIIDFHTHIFPEKIAGNTVDKLSQTSGTVAYSDGTAKGLLRSMRNADISYSVTLPVATNPLKVSHINQAAVFENRDSRIIPFGAMHPDCPNAAEELRRLADFGCKGIKIHPVYQSVDIDDVRYLRILEEAGKLGLIVVTHAGDDIGFPGVIHCSPAMILHAIHEVGPVSLVLAHMGGWGCWEDAQRTLAGTSVYFDTSFSAGSVQLRSNPTQDAPLHLLRKEQLRDMIRALGADRVLFGTDSPWTPQQASADFIRSLGLNDAETDGILWQNAAKLLCVK